MKKVGKVTHYFDNLGVAVLKLDGTIAVGDRIEFRRGEDKLFEQEVSSLQIDHESVKKAGKKNDVAMKVEGKVRVGVEVYK